MMFFFRAVMGALLCLCVAACGGGSAAEPAPPPGPPLQLAVPGLAILKLAASGPGWVALAERPRGFENTTTPDRRLLIAPHGGSEQAPAYVPPAGWSLTDFSVHPSREISVVLASDRELRLLRLGQTGQVLREQAFRDPQAVTDPIIDGPFALMDSLSLVPVVTRDASRLVAVGEDVLLGFRSGRQAVVLHKLAYTASTGFEKRWRSLVEPGVQIGASLPMGGSFDPFKGVDNSWRLLLAADAKGRIAVAVAMTGTELAAGHGRYFGEPLDPLALNGFMLTQFDAAGRRLHSVMRDTLKRSELHSLGWIGDRIVLAGRVRSEATPQGWDAYLAFVPGGGRTLGYRLLDIDQGEVLFDVAGLPNGELLVAGAAGYTQNPTGVSISEQALPLLARLSADGALLQRLPLTPGPRHNQLRALLPWNGRWLLGGMENGPGTHSADADPALRTADGYLREQGL